MKKITATIVYPVNVEVEISDEASIDEAWEAVVKAGDVALRGSPAPVIHDCSHLELVNRGLTKEHITPETQADFVAAATDNLLKSLISFGEVVKAVPFLLNIKTSNGDFIGIKILNMNAQLFQLVADFMGATNPIHKE